MKKTNEGLRAVPGIKTVGLSCGIKKNGKKDLALIYSIEPADTVGLFTSSQVKAAPVLLCRQRLPAKTVQAVIVNSGNANACTGGDGMKDAVHITEILAENLNVSSESVLMCSTGVIGEPLPVEKIEDAIPPLLHGLDSQETQTAKDAAGAILTTDLVTKEAAVKLNIKGKEITIAGMAKGSGMICPDFATMLAFIASDIQLETSALQQALRTAVERSFERITVDGDMSTNDTVLMMANGLSGCSLTPDDDEWAVFQKGLNYVCHTLAKMIVKDGEGATKVIEVRVKKAATKEAARKIARQIANSNLVKTAFFAADANWGRIMGAVGAAGVSLDPDQVDIYIGDTPLVKNGVGLGKEAEEMVNPLLKQSEFAVTVVLNQGRAGHTVWGNDLSYDYIKINAEYRS